MWATAMWKSRSPRRPQPLYGYQGDLRSDSAHVIVRRAHLGRASNDIGFLHQEDGHSWR